MMTMPKGYVKEIVPSRKMDAIGYASVIGVTISFIVITSLFHDNPIVKEIIKFISEGGLTMW
jgi:hypothetical protein